MIDSSTLTFRPYIDNRVKTHPGFVEGLSGPLLLATNKDGQNFIVKYTHFHNAANEFAASWLAQKIGAPAPHAHLLKPSRKFSHQYAVAIEFIEDLMPISKYSLTAQMKKDIAAQFALNCPIDTDDSIHLSVAEGRVYSFDFSEAFFVSDTMMLYTFLLSEDTGKEWAGSKLTAFKSYQSRLSFKFLKICRET